MATGTYTSIITLNVNGLNAPTKRHRPAEWIQNKTHLYATYKKSTSNLKTYKLKVRGWKNIFHANGKQKKAAVSILISEKIDLKTKKITRDKEAHYTMIKGSIQEEDIKIGEGEGGMFRKNSMYIIYGETDHQPRWDA